VDSGTTSPGGDGDLFEWGGPEAFSRQARLDAAYDEYEARHYGSDQGWHHRPYSMGEDLDSPERVRAALEWLEAHRPVNEGPADG
jgi:hypothetical protein